MIAAIIITTALIIFFTTYLVMLTKKTKVDRAFMGIENLINKKNSTHKVYSGVLRARHNFGAKVHC